MRVMPRKPSMAAHVILRALVLVALFSGPGSNQSYAQTLADDIRLRLDELSKPGGNVVGGEAIAAAKFLRDFYEERSFQPAWRDNANSVALVKEIEESRNDGLSINDFHAEALGFGRMDFWPPAMTAAERDILKTSSLINLLYQLYFGKV